MKCYEGGECPIMQAGFAKIVKEMESACEGSDSREEKKKNLRALDEMYMGFQQTDEFTKMGGVDRANLGYRFLSMRDTIRRLGKVFRNLKAY